MNKTFVLSNLISEAFLLLLLYAIKKSVAFETDQVIVVKYLSLIRNALYDELKC